VLKEHRRHQGRSRETNVVVRKAVRNRIGSTLRPRSCPNQSRGFESVHAGHLHIQQDGRQSRIQEACEALLHRSGRAPAFLPRLLERRVNDKRLASSSSTRMNPQLAEPFGQDAVRSHHILGDIDISPSLSGAWSSSVFFGFEVHRFRLSQGKPEGQRIADQGRPVWRRSRCAGFQAPSPGRPSWPSPQAMIGMDGWWLSDRIARIVS